MIKHGFGFVFNFKSKYRDTAVCLAGGKSYVIKLLTVFSLSVEFGVSFQIQ